MSDPPPYDLIQVPLQVGQVRLYGQGADRWARRPNATARKARDRALRPYDQILWGGGRPGTGVCYVPFQGKYIVGKYPICQMYGLIYAICIFNFILRPRTLSTQAILDYIDILLCFSVVLNLKAIFKHEENRPLFVCFFIIK